MALYWCDQSVVPFNASTEIEILPPHSPDSESGLHLIRGIISFFHRDQPGRIRVITRGAVAGVEGTEFVFELDTPTIARVLPMKIKRWDSFSVTNASLSEAKLTYIRLNNQLRKHSRASRLARLVALSRSTKAGHGKLFHFCSCRIEFGDGCDRSSYVDPVYS